MNPRKKKNPRLFLPDCGKRALQPAISLIFSAIILFLILIAGSNEKQNNFCLNRSVQNIGIILQPLEKATPIKENTPKTETPDFVYRWLLQTHREHKKY